MGRYLILCGCLSAVMALGQEPKVRIEKDVAYLPEGRKEKADLYLPAENGKAHPGVLIIHGGGWSGGEKGAAREINIGTTLAGQGYVCMSIDYQLDDKSSPTICWPQNIHDCKTAVRWMRANAKRLHLDVKHIGVIGGSAGGHLAAMVGVTGSESMLDPTGPYGEQSCGVQCVVDLYGPVDVENWKEISALRSSMAAAPNLYRQFSVLTHLNEGDPPVLILHGTEDKTVDVSQSTALAAALAKAGIAHHLEIVEGAPHSFHLEPKQKDLRPLVLGFFEKHLRPNGK